MKKAFHILFSGLLLIATTGFAVGTHYCHGIEVERGLVIGGPEDPCCTGKDMHCCDNEIDYFQVNTAFQVDAPFSFKVLAFPAPTPFLPQTPSFSFYSTPLHDTARMHPPPLLADHGQRLALLQSYLI